MKKTTISFSYDSEKMEAIILFLLQKNMNLNTELATYLDQLFLRHVPANVREFLAMREKAIPIKDKKAKAVPEPNKAGGSD